MEHLTNEQEQSIRLYKLQQKFDNLNFDENGCPIGIDPQDYVELITEIEQIEEYLYFNS